MRIGVNMSKFTPQLLELLTKLTEIRLQVGEAQGQGFLMNAEYNIRIFLELQAHTEKPK